MENNLLYQLLSLCAITKWLSLPLSSQIDSLPGQTSIRLLPLGLPCPGSLIPLDMASLAAHLHVMSDHTRTVASLLIWTVPYS